MSRKKKILLILGPIVLLIVFLFPKNSTDCIKCLGIRQRASFFAGGGYDLCLGIPYSCNVDIPIYRNVPRPTPTQGPTSNWKLYKNSKYNFELKYPPNLVRKEDTTSEQYYDKLAEFSSTTASLTISAIHNIDIYENIHPERVAEREVIDSGYSYWIKNLLVNDYRAVIVALESKPPLYIATIAHPDKNVFIQIGSRNKELLDQTLSTFQFID